MSEKPDYIAYIRSKVGHDKIFLNYCVALIRNETGELLMQRRGNSDLWSFIGGCVELGETFEETLRREIFEEIGLTELGSIRQLGTYNWVDFTYPNGDRVQPIDSYFICDVKAEVNLGFRDTAGETLELRWIAPEAVGSLPLFNPHQLEVVADYLKGRG